MTTPEPTPELTLKGVRIGTREIVRVYKLTHPGNFVHARITADGKFEMETETGTSDPPPQPTP